MNYLNNCIFRNFKNIFKKKNVLTVKKYNAILKKVIIKTNTLISTR